VEKGEGRTPYHHFSAFLAAGIFISQLVWEMGIVLRSHALDYFLLTALFTGSGLFLGAVFHPLAYLSIKKQDSLRRRAIRSAYPWFVLFTGLCAITVFLLVPPLSSYTDSSGYRTGVAFYVVAALLFLAFEAILHERRAPLFGRALAALLVWAGIFGMPALRDFRNARAS